MYQLSTRVLLNKSPTFRMDEMVSPLASVEDSFFSASSLRPTRKSKTVPYRKTRREEQGLTVQVSVVGHPTQL